MLRDNPWCLSEGVFRPQYVLKFKNVWIWSERGWQHFSKKSEIQKRLNYSIRSLYFPEICLMQSSVLCRHLSNPDIYLTQTSLFLRHMSYADIFLTQTSVLHRNLSYAQICLMKTAVFPRHLSYADICLTQRSVLWRQLSYANICLMQTSVLRRHLYFPVLPGHPYAKTSVPGEYHANKLRLKLCQAQVKLS